MSAPRPETIDARELQGRVRQSVWAHSVGALTGPRRLVTLILLVVVWCGLWGSFTIANIAAGIAVGVVALIAGLGGTGRGGIRPWPLLKFSALVGVDMVTSTLAVMREVLTPTDYTEEAIIGVDLPAGAEQHLLLLYVAITVTPGTAVVAADVDGTRVYLHVLHVDKRAQIEEHVIEIAELAVQALPDDSKGAR